MAQQSGELTALTEDLSPPALTWRLTAAYKLYPLLTSSSTQTHIAHTMHKQKQINISNVETYPEQKYPQT